MCFDVQFVMHILKPNSHAYVGFGFWRCRRSNMNWCLKFDAYYEAQKLYCCGLWFYEGLEGQMYVDVKFFMYILKHKCYIFEG